MKGIKQSFQKITSQVQNQIKGCVQCDNNDCKKCKHRNSPQDENGVPPQPGCCDLKVTPFFGSFIEPITSTELSTNPFIIATTDGVSTCQVTLEFFVQNPDNACDTYLNINGIDNLIPTGIPTQFTLNDSDVIYFKTFHRGIDCAVAFATIFNVSCQIDYGVLYVVNFGDPTCDFCPQWKFNLVSYNGSSIWTPPSIPYPGVTLGTTWTNTTNQPIDLFINPTIINNPNIGGERLYLLLNGVQIHTLFDGTTLFPIVYTIGVGEVIGLQQNASTCFETETFFTNETCDIYLGSQIMNNNNPC